MHLLKFVDRFPVLLTAVLFFSSLMYNLECTSVINFGSNRGYVLLVGFLAALGVEKFIFARSKLKQLAGISNWFLLLSIGAVAAYCYLNHIQLVDTDNDELFRLSFSRSVVHSKMPVTYDWFVAGDAQRFNYYILLEYIAAGIHELSRSFLSLEFIYLDVLPWITRLSILLLTFDVTFRMARIQSAGCLHIFYLIPAIIILQFGPSLFIGAVAISLNRQASFACLLLLLAVVFIFRDLDAAGDERRPGLSIWLAWSMVYLLANVKLPLVPVLICGLLGYEGLRVLMDRRLKLGRIFPALFGLLLFAMVFKINPVAVRSKMYWMVDCFYLIERNGVAWFFPGISNRLLAGSMALGFLSLPAAGFALWVSRDQKNFKTVLVGLTFLAAMGFSGLVAGLILRPSVETGGAESYWLLGGWYSLGILFVYSLPKFQSQKSYVTAFLLLPTLSLSIASGYSMWSIAQRASELAPTVAEIKDTCEFITQRIPKLSNVAIAHPWKGLSRYYVNAFCPYPTIISDHHYGEMGDHPQFEPALNFNVAMVTGAIGLKELAEGMRERGLRNLLIVSAFKIPALAEASQFPAVTVGRMTIYSVACSSCPP